MMREMITLAKRHTAKIPNASAAAVIHVRGASDSESPNFGIERKAAKERAIAVSNQSGRSLMTERALVASDAVEVATGSMQAF